MPQPQAVTAAAEDLIRVYTEAWETIVAEQERLLGDPSRSRRRARLTELRNAVERELAALDVPTRDWLQTRLPAIYQAGAQADLGALTWSTLHREAVQQLATDTFQDLLSATRYVRQDTKRLIREASKLASEQTLTTGRTAQQAGRGLSRFLRERGLAAVTYKNGSRHGLAEYSDVVLRSKTAVAYNEGTINAASERGMTVFQVFDGPGCGWEAHGVGPEANGMIVSADEARAFPIAHPRCQRALSARPDLVPQQESRPRTGRTFAAVAVAAIAAVPERQPRIERQPRQPRRPRREPAAV